MSIVENKMYEQSSFAPLSNDFPSDVVREITNEGQVVWLNSAPKEDSSKPTSSQELKSPKV